MVSKGDLTMFRTVLIAIAAIAAAGQALAQPGAPIRTVHVYAGSEAGSWTVAAVGDRTVSHCVMGIRSDAAAPTPGRPQFMLSADRQFAILHVRAAEWTFKASRDIVVTMASGNSEFQPSAVVRGADLIDVALGHEPERLGALAASSHLEIRAEGTVVRLPLTGLAEVLPAYRDCLANVGKPVVQRHAAASTGR
jgi:hypothetical protein